MPLNLRISPSLHQAVPDGTPVSALVRKLLQHAVDNPAALPAAIGNRLNFTAPDEVAKRYVIYIPDDERRAAETFAARFALSTNQLIQILLEDTLYRAGMWP